MRTNDQATSLIDWLSPAEFLDSMQSAVINFDIHGLTSGAVMNLALLTTFLNETRARNKFRRYGYMNNTKSWRVRVSRFFEDRYVHRAQPGFLPELALFGIIVITAIWPMLSLPAVMEMLR